MLQIKNISKKYVTGDLVQHALVDVSVNLRDNEFVAVLGPSGSGKTTLLNIIGGLDHYDSGDLVINGISTKKYRDRDWDSYRNHSIGFVFQSYNLIPHQSILSNVELALTISGISKSERRKKALNALKAVGLKDQEHKKPNQMSGGQMQRVAIARALVNNPDILLADEPTGALDSETSLQVMELLKEVAKDRLVIMVTHNQELAQRYANRIIRIKDGKIIDDTNPLIIQDEIESTHQNMGKASMSFFTALSLSFNNLWTKKARTILTAFAGSIGIIGIALILSLSNGVNQYITDVQKETMTSYPITIDASSIDLSSMFSSLSQTSEKEVTHDKSKVYSSGEDLEMVSQVTASVTENNLTSFKKEVDNPDSEINKYIGENGIVYSYGTNFNIYTKDPDGKIVDVEDTRLFQTQQANNPMANSTTSTRMRGQNNTAQELIPGKEGELVSQMMKDNYEVIEGDWPKDKTDVVLMVDYYNELDLQTVYALGLLPNDEFSDVIEKAKENKEFKAEQYEFDYKDIIGKEFFVVAKSDYYEKKDNDLYQKIEDEKEIEKLVDKGFKLKISGIVRPVKNEPFGSYTGDIGYTNALTHEIIKYALDSDVVKDQLKNPDTNVLNGVSFKPKDNNEKALDMKKTLTEMGVSEKAKAFKQILPSLMANDPQRLQAMLQMDELQLANGMDQYTESLTQEMLVQMYETYISSGSYDQNMNDFGYISLDAPSTISIYADSFEDKDNISKSIENYNAKVDDKDKIQYNDFVALLMSSVTNIINVISYVLIAFVAVSLIVSSIMIGIITYISVLERRKEIGILRSIGASKGNISQVFNAETFIIGLFAGLLGVGISWLLLIPINNLIHQISGNYDINATLPMKAAIILIVISVVLTLLGGLIPSKKAAKQDPVEALRSE